jgi:hypothetical protein
MKKLKTSEPFFVNEEKFAEMKGGNQVTDEQWKGEGWYYWLDSHLVGPFVDRKLADATRKTVVKPATK